MVLGVIRGYELIFLSAMKAGPVYGYELVSRFEKMSRGHLKLSYGTVYPYLRRMEKSGLISSTRDESSRRVYYKLTAKGKLALENLQSKLEESQEDFNEMLLGILAIYSELFGRKTLDKLLRQIE